MKNSKWIIPLIMFSAFIFAVSCGDDETPTGPGTYPTASILSTSTGTTNSIALSWTMCPDENFSEYSLYRSLTEGISANPPESPVRVATNAADTTFTNTGLEWNTDYYYAVRTKNTDNLYSWSNEVSETTPDSGSTGDAYTCYEIQGQQDESPFDGQTVSVTGIVVAGGDEYYSSSSAYAVIMDAGGGAWHGLTLYGTEVASLARGDSITITGTVDEYDYFGAWADTFTELIYPSEVVVHSTGHTLPSPESVNTGNAGQEQWESVLCTISDAIVTEVQGYGQFLVNDGSGNCMVDDMGSYTYSPAVGDTIITGIGILWYSFDEWKLEPRDNNDLITSGGGSGDTYTCYEIQGQQASSPFDGQTVSVTGIITADPDDYTATSSTYSAMADAGGGPWSGLLLYGSDLEGLQRGDSVTITGLVDEYYDMTEIKYPISYVVHSSGHALPDPIQFSTGDLLPSLDLEQWESVFVTVSDVDVTQIDLPYYTWAIDDGSGECYAGTMGDFDYNPAVGDNLSSMTGLLWYSYDFKIQPRGNDDIVQ
ncbi:MAG: hypothetical protein K8R76_12055 [Candidatus Aegiribacteria sp.]|nr:hypothetical protein [Candidatus Aegiribacteria sp.]